MKTKINNRRQPRQQYMFLHTHLNIILICIKIIFAYIPILPFLFHESSTIGKTNNIFALYPSFKMFFHIFHAKSIACTEKQSRYVNNHICKNMINKILKNAHTTFSAFCYSKNSEHKKH